MIYEDSSQYCHAQPDLFLHGKYGSVFIFTHFCYVLEKNVLKKNNSVLLIWKDV